MKQSYDDLLELGGTTKPTWWDEAGVPRFCPPHPTRVNSIYAQEVVFYHVKCQACGERFLVATVRAYFTGSLAEHILDHSIHYGDPPNIGCCAAGPTMNSEPLEVVSFWVRDKKGMDWIEAVEMKGKQLT